jgi:aryl-alcohol dehydrogenase-like predicted oxidoreductase
VSAVTFGSMRLEPARIDQDAAIRLVEAAWDAGIDTFHSSSEYPTHRFFCEVLRAVRGRRPEFRPVHVSKIAVPHFEDPDGFSPPLLRTRVEEQLAELGAERLDIVQWLLRSKPIADAPRLAELERSRESLAEVWSALHREGKVGTLASFPYSMPFAERALDVPPCRGFVTYLNVAELELVPLLPSIERQGQGVIAIRPLSAGRMGPQLWHGTNPDDSRLRTALEHLGVGPNEATSFALRFPLLHPAVASVMLSVSSAEHLHAAHTALEGVSADAARFTEIAARLGGDGRN